MKATLIDMAQQSLAMWKSFLDAQIDRMDKTNLVIDVLTVWFMGQILWFVALVAIYRHTAAGYPFVAAMTSFAIAGLSTIFTIACWEAGKYIWKNGHDGYKHNRRPIA